MPFLQRFSTYRTSSLNCEVKYTKYAFVKTTSLAYTFQLGKSARMINSKSALK